MGPAPRLDQKRREDEDPETAFRRIPGVRPSDEFKIPKYPKSPQYWPGSTFMVFRDGTAIARVMGPYDHETGEWGLLVNVCPGSGISKT